MKSNTNIQYRQVGDFNIPNFILPSEEASVRLGKWGMLHKDYLLKNKKVLFTTLLTQGNSISTVLKSKLRQEICLTLLLTR